MDALTKAERVIFIYLAYRTRLNNNHFMMDISRALIDGQGMG